MNNHRQTNAQLIREAAEQQQQPESVSTFSPHDYESLVNSIDGVVWEFDPAAERFTFLSQQAERLTGYPINQWLFKRRFWLERLHPDDRAWVTHLSARGTQAKRGYELEHRIVCADQRVIWVRSIISVIDNEDQLLRLRGLTVDITARKQAQLALDRHAKGLLTLHETSISVQSQTDLESVLSTIIQRAVELVAVHSGGLFLLTADGQALRLEVAHNLPRDLVGQSIQVGEGLAGRVVQSGQPLIIHDYANWEGRAVFLRQVAARRALGLPLTVGNRVIGALIVIDVALVGSFEGEEVRLLSLLTDQAAVAIEKAQLYEQARLEVAERRRVEAALRQAYAELQLQTEEFHAFAHTVAHDLKNPLSLIMGYAELLEQSPACEQPSYPNLAHSIVLTSEKMNTIIEELMLLAGLREVKAQMEPLGDMARIVAEARQRLSGLIEQRQVQLIVPEEWPVVSGYSPWVEEIWVNYLSNAIKYGGNPPRVELGATPLTTEVCFWVRDNGAGLSPEQQARLFIPFERLDQVQLKGHGLGLSIVRRIVEKMGGQVGVESEVGQGCRFFFTLPAILT